MIRCNLCPRGRRSAFTLVELLVVIAIIGILIALLLPAVQAAREAARRSQCTNNLKQLALGIHNYADIYKSFPSGVIRAEGAGDGGVWGWSALVLPFIEQKPLHDSLGVTQRSLLDVLTNVAAGDATDTALLQTGIDSYLCPSSKTREILTDKVIDRNWDGGGLTLGSFRAAASNYPGVAGLFQVGEKNTGVLANRDTIMFQDISDGTSNTLAIGEREDNCGAGYWVGSRNADGDGPRGSDYVLGHVHFPINYPINTQTSDSCLESFTSLHPGGANFAMCDGSVRFLSETIDFKNPTVSNWNYVNLSVAQLDECGTYQLLGMREDGLPVSNF